MGGHESLQHGECINQYPEYVDLEDDSPAPCGVSESPGFDETTHSEMDCLSPLLDEPVNTGSGLRHDDEGLPGVAAQVESTESHIPDPLHNKLALGVSGSETGDDLEGTYLEL